MHAHTKWQTFLVNKPQVCKSAVLKKSPKTGKSFVCGVESSTFCPVKNNPGNGSFGSRIKSVNTSALFRGLNNYAFYTHYRHFAHIQNFNANIRCDLVSANSFKSTAEFIAELSASQPGETWQCLGTFLVVRTGRRGCYWQLVGQGQGCGPAKKNDPLQNVNTAAAEKDFCN